LHGNPASAGYPIKDQIFNTTSTTHILMEQLFTSSNSTPASLDLGHHLKMGAFRAYEENQDLLSSDLFLVAILDLTGALLRCVSINF
jgi:hypothetical protein